MARLVRSKRLSECTHEELLRLWEERKRVGLGDKPFTHHELVELNNAWIVMDLKKPIFEVDHFEPNGMTAVEASAELDRILARGLAGRKPATGAQPVVSPHPAPMVTVRAFRVLELVIAGRIANEEIGDAMEAITMLHQEGRPAWQIQVKVISTVFWVLVHAMHAVFRGPAKQKS